MEWDNMMRMHGIDKNPEVLRIEEIRRKFKAALLELWLADLGSSENISAALRLSGLENLRDKDMDVLMDAFIDEVNAMAKFLELRKNINGL